jgi:hypothetical protein
VLEAPQLGLVEHVVRLGEDVVVGGFHSVLPGSGSCADDGVAE